MRASRARHAEHVVGYPSAPRTSACCKHLPPAPKKRDLPHPFSIPQSFRACSRAWPSRQRCCPSCGNGRAVLEARQRVLPSPLPELAAASHTCPQLGSWSRPGTCPPSLEAVPLLAPVPLFAPLFVPLFAPLLVSLFVPLFVPLFAPLSCDVPHLPHRLCFALGLPRECPAAATRGLDVAALGGGYAGLPPHRARVLGLFCRWVCACGLACTRARAGYGVPWCVPGLRGWTAYRGWHARVRHATGQLLVLHAGSCWFTLVLAGSC
jgi:hypothetical protein